MQKKILQVATISNTVNSFLIPHINMLQENGFSVDIACNIINPIQTEKIKKTTSIFDISFQRSPLSIENRKAYKDIKKVLEKNNYDVVHVHTPVAAAITRLVVNNMKIKPKIIYTAHGFHFYRGAPRKNWLIFYPIEKYLSNKTDILITINEEDYNFSRKKFKTEIRYIPGVGIDLDSFQSSLTISEKMDYKESLGLHKDDFVLTCIGELNQNKNQKFLIDMLLNDRKNMKLLIIGIGNQESELIRKVKSMGLSEQVLFLGYRTDIVEILSVTNILVAASFREGLPVNIIEGMAMGLPVVALKNRGINDLIENNTNGFVTGKNELEFYQRVLYLYDNDNVVKDISSNNLKASLKYGIENINIELLKIYDSLI